NQPYIGLWNCSALGHALSSLVSEESQGEILQTYEPIFQKTLAKLYQKKLGLIKLNKDDAQLIQGLLDIMESEKLDYTNTFRNISQAITNEETPELNTHIAKSWIKSYQARHKIEPSSIEGKVSLINKNNPKFILRNYMAQEAIEAAENLNLSVLETLIQVITHPYDELEQFEYFASRSPDWAKDLEISCSS
ncbi:MAG: hypothetical protein DBW98_01425, partial [SAR86 cluster bacterium]